MERFIALKPDCMLREMSRYFEQTGEVLTEVENEVTGKIGSAVENQLLFVSNAAPCHLSLRDSEARLCPCVTEMCTPTRQVMNQIDSNDSR